MSIVSKGGHQRFLVHLSVITIVHSQQEAIPIRNRAQQERQNEDDCEIEVLNSDDNDAFDKCRFVEANRYVFCYLYCTHGFKLEKKLLETKIRRLPGFVHHWIEVDSYSRDGTQTYV